MKSLAGILLVAAITVIGITVLFVVPIMRHMDNRLPRKWKQLRKKQAEHRRNQPDG